MTLTLPDRDKRALIDLVELPEASFDKLLQALKESKPTHSTKALTSRIMKQVEMNERQLRPIVAALMVLHATKEFYQVTTDKLIHDLLETASSDSGVFKGIEGKAELFKKRILAFLQPDSSLELTAKAANILRRNKNLFASARILTDIRPIFRGEALKPEAGMIIHNLEILSHTDDTHVSHYFALDMSDLKKLRALTERAIRKEENLRSSLELANLDYIEIRDEQDEN